VKEQDQEKRTETESLERRWLTMQECGTCVKFTPAGAELFA
jgi:hypothetical protein